MVKTCLRVMSAMYLSRLEISNFRCFKHVVIPFSKGVTTIIGENNIGKTSVVRALGLLFSDGPWASRSLSDEDFYQEGSSRKEVLPVVRIRATLAECQTDDEVSLTFQWLTSKPGKAQLTYEFRPGPKCPGADAIDLNTPLPLDKYQWVIYGGEKETDQFDFSALRQISLETLPALRDAETSLSRGRGRLSRLLSYFETPVSQRTLVGNHAAQLNEAVQGTTPVQSVQREINAKVKSMSGPIYSQQASLMPNPIEYQSLLKSINLMVDPGCGFTLPLDQNGLGYNNLLYIAAVLSNFDLALRNRKVALPIIAIEEPEAHLHPHLEKGLTSYLRGQKDSAQVILTTHSTHISSGLDLGSLVILHRSRHREVSAFGVGQCFKADDRAKRDLERYLDATRFLLFFGRSLILVEGIAEALLLPPLMRAMDKEYDPNRLGISIVPVGGVSFKPFIKLFGESRLERPCAVLTDGDPPSETYPATGQEVEVSDRVTSLLEAAKDNAFVRVFHSKKTLEYDLLIAGNKTQIIRALRTMDDSPSSESISDLENETELVTAGKKLLRLIENRKGRFVQALANEINESFAVPDYIKNAFSFVKDGTGHTGAKQ
jgi:putative ATP-dependent endonuclease of OLD family